MSLKNYFEFFINFIFPVIILFFGLIGNSLGILVVLRKRLKSIGPTLIYCFMFAADWAYLIQIVITYLDYGYRMQIDVQSRISCKTWIYFNYAFGKILLHKFS
jgi:hypothetical protein